MTSEVYFTKNLTSEALVKIFDAVEKINENDSVRQITNHINY